MRSGKGIVVFVVIVAIVAGVGFAVWKLSKSGKHKIGIGQRPKAKEWYEEDVKKLAKVDPKFVRYRQDFTFPVKLRKPTGIAVSPAGRVYVSGDKELLSIDMRNRRLFRIQLDSAPNCVAVGGDSLIYVGMKDHVEVYKGRKLQVIWESLGEKAFVTSIAETEENVFVADAGNKVVWRFNKEGDMLGEIGRKDQSRSIPGLIVPSHYMDVAIDKLGALWVVNPGRQSIENYTAEGELRTSWGKASMGLMGFCGCCNPTHIAIMANGSFVTSEKGIARVKVYSPAGKFVSVVAAPEQFEPGTVGLDVALDKDGGILVLDPTAKVVRVFVKKR